MKNCNLKLTFSAQDIKTVCDLIDALPEKYFNSPKERMALRLSCEETMLKQRDYYGENYQQIFIVYKKFNTLILTQKVIGEQYNPTEDNSDDKMPSFFLATLYEHISDTPTAKYVYKNRVNTIETVLHSKEKLPMPAKILIALLVGLIIGFGAYLLPGDAVTGLSELLTVASKVIMNLIIMSASVTVFLIVINSISDSRSLGEFKLMGTTVLKTYLLRTVIAMLLVVMYAFLTMNFTFDASKNGFDFIGIIKDFLANFFPTNILSPFIDGNFAHIVLLGIVIGVGCLIVGNSAAPVISFFKSASDISTTVMEGFCSLIPFYFALVVPNIIWSNQVSKFSGFLIHMLMVVAIIAVLYFVYLLIVSLRIKTSPLKVLKACYPVLLKAFVTSSTVSSISEASNSSVKLGTKKSFADFSSTMGLMLGNAEHFVYIGIIMLYAFSDSGSAISVSVVINLLISIFCVTLAIPPVSNGVIAVSAIIISSQGLPDTYIAIASAANLFLDFFLTAFRCGGITLVSVLSEKKYLRKSSKN